jgi:hypothetical protein
MCQARYLPPSPLPRMSISKWSGWDIFNPSSFESERQADEQLDPPQQVVRRNAVFKAKLVEYLSLVRRLPSHHGTHRTWRHLTHACVVVIKDEHRGSALWAPFDVLRLWWVKCGRRDLMASSPGPSTSFIASLLLMMRFICCNCTRSHVAIDHGNSTRSRSTRSMPTSNGLSHSTCPLPRNACTMGAFRRSARATIHHVRPRIPNRTACYATIAVEKRGEAIDIRA